MNAIVGKKMIKNAVIRGQTKETIEARGLCCQIDKKVLGETKFLSDMP